jgi:hypothetical protein
MSCDASCCSAAYQHLAIPPAWSNDEDHPRFSATRWMRVNSLCDRQLVGTELATCSNSYVSARDWACFTIGAHRVARRSAVAWQNA